MAAYIIARVSVTDPDQYAKYKLLTPEAIESSGGRFIVRGGASEVLEGIGDDRRVVVLEFPDTATAKAFYDSPAYTHAREVREGAADMEMILVDGV